VKRRVNLSSGGRRGGVLNSGGGTWRNGRLIMWAVAQSTLAIEKCSSRSAILVAARGGGRPVDDMAEAVMKSVSRLAISSKIAWWKSLAEIRIAFCNPEAWQALDRDVLIKAGIGHSWRQ